MFKPDRFIDPITGKYCKSKHEMPIGPRMCLGYKLADLELFMILCSLLIKYKISASVDIPDFASVDIPEFLRLRILLKIPKSFCKIDVDGLLS